MKKTVMALTLASAFTLVAAEASASLILLAPEDFGGTGLGAVNTILTIQDSPTEDGKVAWNGTTDVITGDAKTGASQTQTRTLTELGVTSASNLRVVFNANQISDGPINLTNLVLTIYNTDGSIAFTSGAFSPVNFANTYTGTGNSGFVFGLDAAQAAAAQASAFAGSFGVRRVGLEAAASLTNDGQETFFVANAGLPPLTGPIPEPGTLALLASGLLGFGGVGRWRKREG